MRLLKVVVRGAGLFSEGTFSIDFFAADRVAGMDSPFFNNVFSLGAQRSLSQPHVVPRAGLHA